MEPVAGIRSKKKRRGTNTPSPNGEKRPHLGEGTGSTGICSSKNQFETIPRRADGIRPYDSEGVQQVRYEVIKEQRARLEKPVPGFRIIIAHLFYFCQGLWEIWSGDFIDKILSQSGQAEGGRDGR
jgi:hypothetical protein